MHRYSADLPGVDRNQWISTIWRAWEANSLTRTERDAARVILRFFNARKGCFPSHATLASLARCSVSTVQRALAALKRLGLIAWRLVYRNRRRSHCHYWPLLPDEAAKAQLFRPIGQKDRRKEPTQANRGIERLQPAAAEAQLAEIRRDRLRKLAQLWARP